jgi:Pentapeptide repeats (8 copies)
MYVHLLISFWMSRVGLCYWHSLFFMRRDSLAQRSADTDQPPATDIQAAITVIGRRAAGTGVVDFTNSHISKADLSFAALTKADLTKTLLSFTKLIRADLRDANLSGADLLSANLSGAALVNADLSPASGADGPPPGGELSADGAPVGRRMRR